MSGLIVDINISCSISFLKNLYQNKTLVTDMIILELSRKNCRRILIKHKM